MMSKIVRTVSKVVFLLSVLFGFYIIAEGHLTPGGGFQGGAVVASGFALLIVAFGYESLVNHKELFAVLESLALLAFLGLAIMGIKIMFFYNILAKPVAFGPNPGYLISGGFVPLMNIAVGLEVIGSISLILIWMARTSYVDKLDNQFTSYKGLNKGTSIENIKENIKAINNEGDL